MLFRSIEFAMRKWMKTKENEMPSDEGTVMGQKADASARRCELTALENGEDGLWAAVSVSVPFL